MNIISDFSELSGEYECTESVFSPLLEEYYFSFTKKKKSSKIKKIQFTFDTEKKLIGVNITKKTGNYDLTWKIERDKDKEECFKIFVKMRIKHKTKWLLKGIESEDFSLKGC